LDAASIPEDMNLPGFKLHAIKGVKKLFYSVWVSGNWHLTFSFDGKDAIAGRIIMRPAINAAWLRYVVNFFYFAALMQK